MEEYDCAIDFDSVHNTIILDKFKLLYVDNTDDCHTYNIFVKKWMFWWNIFSYTAETKELAYKHAIDVFKKLSQLNKRK